MTATVPTSDELAIESRTRADADASIMTALGLLGERVAALEADGPLPPPVDPPPPVGRTVTVTTLSSLKAAIADDANDYIRVLDNTFALTGDFQITSKRTRPVKVLPDKVGWALDAGGRHLRPLWFHAGASLIRIEGLTIQNVFPEQAGAIVFGNDSADAPAVDCVVAQSTIAASVIGGNAGHEHGVYWTGSTPTRCGVEDLTINLSASMEAGLHFYHDPNARDCFARRVRINGAQQPVMLWSDLSPLLLEDITVTGARKNALRYEYGSKITIRRYTASGGKTNFESTKGSYAALKAQGVFLDGSGVVLS